MSTSRNLVVAIALLLAACDRQPTPAPATAPPPPPTMADLLTIGRQQIQHGDTEAALATADRILEQEPANPRAKLLRATAFEIRGELDKVLAIYNELLTATPDHLQLLMARGALNFRAGRFKDSVADYDAVARLKPQAEAQLWQRGISHYYAGMFSEGAKQFDIHRTVNPNDVENSIWHFLCNARIVGVDKARAAYLKVQTPDKRIPMMEIDRLYTGDASVEDVLTAAKAGNPSPRELTTRMFHVHLYVGLYLDTVGQTEAALEHLEKAVKSFTRGPYMWQVARIHHDIVKAKLSAQSLE